MKIEGEMKRNGSKRCTFMQSHDVSGSSSLSANLILNLKVELRTIGNEGDFQDCRQMISGINFSLRM